jgi:UDP-N-acetylmuramate dehydrogenase
VIGNGSNLLVADAGIRGIVVQLGGALAGCERVAEDEIILGAGLKLMVLQNRAFKEGWTGLECFAGIPGTVGGAVRMNAGSQLGEVVNNLNWIEVVTITGLVKRIPAADLGMSYRTSNLPKGAVVTAAGMRLTDEPADQHQLRVRLFLERRKVTQPLDLPSCGSTFRNPQGDHAGRLIEAAGLKGFQVGGAQVSTKHANFVVNLGGATAADIRSVIEAIQTEVLERFQVQLLREVHFVGDWSDWSVSE